jgi:cell division protein FtsI (penicillin-binding protein 3)
VDQKWVDLVKAAMVDVTRPGGTAARAGAGAQYTFAGKTGTAQKVDPVTRHYSTDKWASSFVGFAPADDPRLVLFVMVDEPQGTHYGSMVAGPVFQETMIDALRWLGVPPNAPLPQVAQKPAPAAAPVPAAHAAPVDESEEDGEDAGFVAAADDPRDRAARPSEVPDFSGMSVAEALGAARLAGVRLEIQGSGIATAQTPGPGEARRGAACRVVFTPPG